MTLHPISPRDSLAVSRPEQAMSNFTSNTQWQNTQSIKSTLGPIGHRFSFTAQSNMIQYISHNSPSSPRFVANSKSSLACFQAPSHHTHRSPSTMPIRLSHLCVPQVLPYCKHCHGLGPIESMQNRIHRPWCFPHLLLPRWFKHSPFPPRNRESARNPFFFIASIRRCRAAKSVNIQ